MKIKVSATKVKAFREAANGETNGGVNTHPWADPVKALYGSWGNNPDFLDFFKRVGKKKSLESWALTAQDLIYLVVNSTRVDEATNTPHVHNGEWGVLMEGRGMPKGFKPEGSCYSTWELEGIAFDTRKHYALVSVASGFDWAARAVNMKGLVSDMLWDTELPGLCWQLWDTTTLVVMWVVYEGLGLGGLNKKALEWHGLIRQYCRKGSFNKGFWESTPEPFWEDEFYAAGSDAEQFLHLVWKSLLKSEGIQTSIVEDIDIWSTVLFLAHCREIASRLASGKELSDYHKGYTWGNLAPSEVQFLAVACAVMRAAAKGRLSIEEGDDFEQSLSLCQQLLVGNYAELCDELTQEGKSPSAQFLRDILPILNGWEKGRNALLSTEENFWG